VELNHDIINIIFFCLNFQEAENFSEEDKKIKEKVESRNELESYAYSLKNQIGDKDKLGAKLSEEEKTKIEEALDASIKWLESNQEADSADFKKQKKELEDIVQPIIAKLYQQPGGAPPTDSADSEKDEL
jgi:heat shock protein 5